MIVAEFKEVSLRYRGPLLLDQISCQIRRGQRIGLLGRNGSGKTTLMRMLVGEVEPDSGEVLVDSRIRVALLPQDVPRDIHGPSRDVVAAGCPASDDPEAAWRVEQQVKETLSRMELDGSALFETLSSGMKRRVLLARALAARPSLLLLDEPTNHLDIAAIDWLERFLERWDGTLMFVTHDRMLLRKLASRILEIDGGRLFDWSCDYDTFLKRKDQALAAEAKQQALFDKRLAQEEVWIRQGIKARRTRNEGRVRALEQMRRQRQERRGAIGTVRLQLQQELRSGTLVADADNVSFSYGERPVVSGFSTGVARGDKIGIIGPNGAGKTTLLRLLLGELTPTQGSIRLGTNLQIAYFDQLRAQLNEERTVLENVNDGYETIRIGDKSQHVIGYLQNFLFSAERARTPVRYLSGGERNRLLLARLFAKPANVLVLDEPTNDLDLETLELLEELLVECDATVLLVSHDREFLNNVVVSTIVFEGQQLKEYVGGYDDWVRQRDQAPAAQATEPKSSAGRPPRQVELPAADRADARRLSYKEKQELAALPTAIEQLETEVRNIHQEMSNPAFYKQSGEEIARQTSTLRQLEQQVATAYQRWEELEARTVPDSP